VPAGASSGGELAWLHGPSQHNEEAALVGGLFFISFISRSAEKHIDMALGPFVELRHAPEASLFVHSAAWKS
jgi:hypothetical protein